MATGRAIEPVAAILALGVGEPLLFFAFGTHAIHLAMFNVIFEDQSAFRTNLGIATMVGGFAARSRAGKDGVTGITPVFAAGHFLTYGALIHRATSIDSC